MKSQSNPHTLQDNGEPEQPSKHKPMQSAWITQQWLIRDAQIYSQGDTGLLVQMKTQIKELSLIAVVVY